MLTRPDALEDAALCAAVRDGWGLNAVAAEYLPAGFGSHHWIVSAADGGRRFVTVDDLGSREFLGGDRAAAFDGLTRAFAVAQVLHDRGLDWVVSPLSRADGGVLRWLDERHSIAVFPWVDGTASSAYGSDAERVDVLALLGELHRSGEPVRTLARSETFELPDRVDLEAGLLALDERWTGGPYSDPTRLLLREHAGEVQRLLADYDRLAEQASRDRSSWTITHGEPHSRNVLRTHRGLRLIDWDTALFAPPERDLWMLLPVGGSDSLSKGYTEVTGHRVDPAALRLYALWWDLCDTAIYVAGFRGPHLDDEDAKVSWHRLREILQAGDRWGE